MAKNLVIVLFVICCLTTQIKTEDLVFDATVTHKFVWTDSNPNITGGWTGAEDTPELQDSCAPWVGFYTEFAVDLSTQADYNPNGDDMKICLTAISTQAFGTSTKFWVNDAINNVIWPNPPADFDPAVTKDTMYASPNGFDSFFKEENDRWCIVGGFSKMIGAYSGQKTFTFKAAVVLENYAACENDPDKKAIVQFYGADDATNKPKITFNTSGGDTSGGTKWYLWIGGIVIVAGLIAGGFFYWKSRGGDGGYTM